jgi:hypothetical protein
MNVILEPPSKIFNLNLAMYIMHVQKFIRHSLMEVQIFIS